MQQEPKHIYEFGPFRLEPVRRVLLKDGEKVTLTPKAFDALLVLVENGGQLLGKEEMMKYLWPDSFVEEGNLTVTISMLRKALGESRGEHPYIVTEPGKGYRFVADVQEMLEGEDEVVFSQHDRTLVVINQESWEPAAAGEVRPRIARLSQLLRRRSVFYAVSLVLVASVLLAVALWKIVPHWMSRPLSPASLRLTRVADWKTDSGVPDAVPRFSRDGRMIAYTTARSGQSNISVKQMMGGNPIRVTDGPWIDHTPIWSPDNQKLAYISNRGKTDRIWLSLYTGGTAEPVTSISGASKQLRYWSKDNKTIYYEVDHNLYALDIDTKGVTRLTDFDSSSSFSRDFSISPDETSIAYTNSQNGQFDIWTMPINGGTPHQITNDAADDMYPVWHPDGRRIIYSSNRGGSYQICVGNVDGSEPQQLTFNSLDCITPDVTQDDSALGAKILYQAIKEESDIWRLAISGGESRVTSDVGLEYWPQVCPDGQTLIYQAVGCSERFFNSSVFARPVSAEGQQRRLADNGFFAVPSPDGAKVGFLRFSQGRCSLWSIDAVGGVAIQLAADMTPPSFGTMPLNRQADGGYSWSPSGGKIAYCARDSNRSNIWTVPINGSAPERISDNGAPATFFTCPRWSPDGSRIASVLAPEHTSADTTEGWRVWVNGAESVYRNSTCLSLVGWLAAGDSLIGASADDYECGVLTGIDLIRISLNGRTQIISRLPLTYSDNIEMSPDGSAVAFVSRLDGNDNIWIIAPGGGTPRQLTTNNDPNLYFSSISWSPDGKAIYFGKQPLKSSEILMIENLK